MNGQADLHLHTSYSDGAHLPHELLKKAKAAGLSAISITDHDTVGAIAEAKEIGLGLGVEVIPGVELSAAFDAGEIHILGYFFDVDDPGMLAALDLFRERRLRRIERIIDKLNKLNIPLSMDAVLEMATGDSVGRPHVANAMVSYGHADSYYQAFHRYLGDGRPAFERKENFTPEETIRLIADAGGLSFLAHPGTMVNEALIKRLIDAGLDGIEVVHPSHTPEQSKYYRKIVDQYYLLESGGSDYHGGLKNDDRTLGTVTIPLTAVDIMRRRLF